MIISEEQWETWLGLIGIPDAELLWEKASRRPWGRVYRQGPWVYKIHIHHQCSATGCCGGIAQDQTRADHLRMEYRIVRRCHAIDAIPFAVRHDVQGVVEYAVYRAVDAQSLRDVTLSLPRLVMVLAQLAAILLRLSWRGISHNDLYPHNVLMDAAGRCYLIDFDAATVTTPGRALYRNFFRDRRGDEQGLFWASLYEFTWMMLCRALARPYRIYDRWVEVGWHRLRSQWAGGAVRCAARGLLMRPWRPGAWRLLWHASSIRFRRRMVTG